MIAQTFSYFLLKLFLLRQSCVSAHDFEHQNNSKLVLFYFQFHYILTNSKKLYEIGTNQVKLFYQTITFNISDSTCTCAAFSMLFSDIIYAKQFVSRNSAPAVLTVKFVTKKKKLFQSVNVKKLQFPEHATVLASASKGDYRKIKWL